MISVYSFLTLLLAFALPSAFAGVPKLCRPYKTVEIYRKDLPDEADFHASGSADAYGENTYTYVDQYLYQFPGYNDYVAYLGGSASDPDHSSVYVYNSGNGKALDCDRIWEYQYVLENKFWWGCYYEIEFRTRKACDIAKSYFTGYAYATGEYSYADLSVYSYQTTRYASTDQYLSAYGDDSASGYLWNQDYVKDMDNNYNTATASADVNCYAYDTKGGCSIYASTHTYAGQGYSGSHSSINSTSGGRKLL